jgi:hypothetical protein
MERCEECGVLLMQDGHLCPTCEEEAQEPIRCEHGVMWEDGCTECMEIAMGYTKEPGAK